MVTSDRQTIKNMKITKSKFKWKSGKKGHQQKKKLYISNFFEKEIILVKLVKKLVENVRLIEKF